MKGKVNVLSEVNIFMTIYNLTRCINIMDMDELKRRLRAFLPLVSLYMSSLLTKYEMQKIDVLDFYKTRFQVKFCFRDRAIHRTDKLPKPGH